MKTLRQTRAPRNAARPGMRHLMQQATQDHSRDCCRFYSCCIKGINNDINTFFRHDSTEMDPSENEDITLKRADSTDKVLKHLVSWYQIRCRLGAAVAQSVGTGRLPVPDPLGPLYTVCGLSTVTVPYTAPRCLLEAAFSLSHLFLSVCLHVCVIQTFVCCVRMANRM